MNIKQYRFLENKLVELTDNDIISIEQLENAKNYFSNKKEKSVVTIFGAIGILLIALSIITLFAINWDSIPISIKTLISFVPIIITSIMLFFYLKTEKSSLRLYTSIFAPVSIIATNSLISQIFHIQTEIYELFFICLLMFLPITFILSNHISFLVYGIGTISYASMAITNDFGLINTFILFAPLILFNVFSYIKGKNDSEKITLWIINVIIASIILFAKEFLSFNVFLIYLYMIYFITKTLFDENNSLNILLSKLFVIYLIVSCIDPSIVSFAQEIEFGVDTLLVTIATIPFMYLSKVYKEPKEYFILVFLVLLQYTKMEAEVLFVFVNIVAVAFGIYKIINGNKLNSYHETKQGISTILLLILFRFINSDMSFSLKSIMFLISGICFMITSNLMKKRIGGDENDE